MTPKKAYDDQRRHAAERNIDWNISYAEWLELWLISGKWEQRGKGSGKYQMCRLYDEGSYSVKNCYIGTQEENQQDRWKISDKQTQNIIKLYYSGKYSQRELADLYGLCQSSISRIVNRKRRINDKHYS